MSKSILRNKKNTGKAAEIFRSNILIINDVVCIDFIKF